MLAGRFRIRSYLDLVRQLSDIGAGLFKILKLSPTHELGTLTAPPVSRHCVASCFQLLPLSFIDQLLPTSKVSTSLTRPLVSQFFSPPLDFATLSVNLIMTSTLNATLKVDWPIRATTFHRFEELPIELRIHIWRYAAAPDERVSPKQFRRLLPPYCGFTAFICHLTPAPAFNARAVNAALFYHLCEKRGALMRSCHLSRHVALEAWRKDVLLIQEGGRLYSCYTLKVGNKVQILHHLHGLLG